MVQYDYEEVMATLGALDGGGMLHVFCQVKGDLFAWVKGRQREISSLLCENDPSDTEHRLRSFFINIFSMPCAVTCSCDY